MDYNITYRKKNTGLQVIVSYKDSKGKWKQKSKQGFPDTRDGKKQARAEADRIVESLKDISTNNLSSDYSEITYKEYCALYINHIRLYKAIQTVKVTEVALKKFNALDDKILRNITNADIQLCINELTAKGLKYNSIKNYLARLTAALNSATKQFHILPKSPIVDIELKKPKKTENVKALTTKEFNDVIETFENSPYDNYTIILIIAGTCGLRIGEILGLTWSDIDFNNNTMDVNKQWKVIETEPYKKFGFGELKTQNSYRIVPIPKYTADYLKKYRNSHPINFQNRLIKSRSTESVNTFLNKKLKILGYNVTIHDFRHTYATKLIANGVDFKTAAKLLGHEVEQTMKTYSHVTQDMLDRAKNLINNIF